MVIKFKTFSPYWTVQFLGSTSIGTDTAYMYIPDTYGRGKLSNNFLEKKLGVAATTRNANTLRKMVEMAEEIGG